MFLCLISENQDKMLLNDNDLRWVLKIGYLQFYCYIVSLLYCLLDYINRCFITI